MRKIFGPWRDKVMGDGKKLRNDQLRYLYSLPNITQVIKSRRIRRAGHVARMMEKKNASEVWWKQLRERDHLED
jgi:hypothetical protein